MSVYSSAIAGRLNIVSPSDSPDRLKILRPQGTAYSVARFGLVRPVEQERTAEKAATAKPPSPYGKGTYKLSHLLLARLRTCATDNNKYQYAVVAEALQGYFDRSTPAPSPAKTETNIDCWHRFKRVVISRFRPIRRTN